MKWMTLDESLEGKTRGAAIVAYGRIREVRKHKNRLFVDIADHRRHIQLVVERPLHPNLYEGLAAAGKGAFVSVEGTLGADRQRNPEIIAERVDVLATSSLDIPSPWSIDGSDPRYGHDIFSFPEIYVANMSMSRWSTRRVSTTSTGTASIRRGTCSCSRQTPRRSRRRRSIHFFRKTA
ncbi:hypothetical protein JXB02_01305 [Candidatus Woesearchaeota archaeon]|nr:hypothetical protein [Candidatus Woesearchaeota archaeon]